MQTVIKVRGIHLPQLGKVGVDRVLRYCEATIVAVPGTQVHDYLSQLPPDVMELDYTPDLFFRWIPGLSYEQLWLGDYRYGGYWDAIMVAGLIPGVVFALPNTPELQSALLLGRGLLFKMHGEFFDRYQTTAWREDFEIPRCERAEVPMVVWTEHTF